MRFLAGCVLSAVLASLFTIWMLDDHTRQTAIAQDASRPFPLFAVPAQGKGKAMALPASQVSSGAPVENTV